MRMRMRTPPHPLLFFSLTDENMAKAKKVLRKRKEIKVKKDFNLKECFVKLEKIDNLLRPKERKKIITKTLNVRINKSQLIVNNVQIHESAFRVFNIKIKMRSNEMIIQQLTNTKTISEAPEQSPFPLQNITNEAVFEISPKVQRRVRIPTIYELTNSAWRRCLAASKKNGAVLTVGQHVMAKMKSWSPWPAVIISFNANKKRVNVFFYGTKEEGKVDSQDIAQFGDSCEVIRLLLLRKNTLFGFEKGIREVETLNNIPIELSMTTEQKTIQSNP